MARYARIEDARVFAIEIISVPQNVVVGRDIFVGINIVECSDESVVEGWGYVNGEFTPPPPPPPPDLDAVKARLKAAIDAEAEAQRLRYIVDGAGQAMTYARKVEQAKAVQAAVDPQPDDYPMLAASIGIDGADITAVAATILAMDAIWERIGAAIEATRLTAKRAIDLAGTVAAAQAVTVPWPEPDMEQSA